mmetsp:Transcript_3087/g.4746  ORF Transcript_3087/g.4746 Transcript_3087/m.4746 type:complete len:225 (+) Transcript_3087:642-1316(+)
MKSMRDLGTAFGPPKEVETFAHFLRESLGLSLERGLTCLSYSLTEVKMPERKLPAKALPGTLQLADRNDVATVAEFYAKFLIDVKLSDKEMPMKSAAKWAAKEIERGAIFLWTVNSQLGGELVDSTSSTTTVVSMVSIRGGGKNFVRIGMVFTPKRYRRCGYASNAVAALCRHALEGKLENHEGIKRIVLLADEENNSSRGIYESIGFVNSHSRHTHIRFIKKA